MTPVPAEAARNTSFAAAETPEENRGSADG